MTPGSLPANLRKDCEAAKKARETLTTQEEVEVEEESTEQYHVKDSGHIDDDPEEVVGESELRAAEVQEVDYEDQCVDCERKEVVLLEPDSLQERNPGTSFLDPNGWIVMFYSRNE